MANDLVVNNSFIAPVADLAQAKQRYQAVKDFINSILVEGIDYGTVPGSDKKVLLKPGAEKMCSFFGFSTRFILEDKVEDWIGDDHKGEPFFYYRFNCQLWRDNQLIAEGQGSCNSFEKKFRYRKAERVCPACGKAAIIKGKPEFGGGWLCWTKKDGCGSKFSIDDPLITEQEVGEIKNSDPAEQVNTYLKMAQKRALVAPVLIATNTSDYFTQDLDDFIEGEATDLNQPKRPNTPKPVPPAQPGEKPMKPSSTDAVEIFEKLSGLGTTEAAKTLIAHFKSTPQVTASQIEAFWKEWAGMNDGLEASRESKGEGGQPPAQETLPNQ